MLLDIETSIGEIAVMEKRIPPHIPSKGGKGTPKGGSLPSNKPPKHERLGLPKKRMAQSQKIAKHPEIVERVKAKAREFLDGNWKQHRIQQPPDFFKYSKNFLPQCIQRVIRNRHFQSRFILDLINERLIIYL